MKTWTFYRKLNNKKHKITLTLKERINNYSVVCDLDIDGICDIKNVEGDIRKVLEQRGKLFLKVHAGDNDIMLKICDKNAYGKYADISKSIADYIWENVQLEDYLGTAKYFTTRHINDY